MNLFKRIIYRLKTVLREMKNVKRRRDFSKFRKFGNGAGIGEYYKISSFHEISIGDDAYIGPHAYIAGDGGLYIGNGVMIGPMVYIQTSNHNYDSSDLMALPYDHRVIRRPIHIDDYVWLGGRVTVLPGVTIGSGAVVGAGSVVTNDIPPLAIAVGNPAKVIRYRNSESFFKLSAEKKSHRIWVLEQGHPIEWIDEL